MTTQLEPSSIDIVVPPEGAAPPASPSRIAAAVALAVALAGFLPIANWIPGGHQAPWYRDMAMGWLNGSLIAIGVGVILAILSRRIVALWRARALDRLVALWDRRPLVVVAVIIVAAFALYLWAARHVFSGRPLLIDELVQLFQAQIFAGGALSRPAFSHPEFFSSINLVDTQGRVYSQFPAGGPAMLTLGVLIGASWLVGPICGAIAVAAFAAYVRRTETSPGVSLLATAIFALAPFAVFMSGSQMNHVTTLLWVGLAIATLAAVVTADRPRPWLALACGFAFGMAGTIRPVDAFTFALPAGLWLLARALREPRRWADALPAALGVAIPMSALLWVNARTTGAPLLFGYEVLWGKGHELGFHAAPWGVSHTPARGLELVNLYFLELQTYFLETPIPSLVPAIAALALTSRFDRFDRYLLCSSALLVGFYFAYWHDGFYLGPRFMYPLLPPLAIWTARFFPLARAWLRDGLAYRATVYASLCALGIAAAVDIPIRALQYEGNWLTMRWNADRAAATSGVRDALVLVRESWGTQLVARLWALGVTRPETELLYGHVDACALEQRLDAIERSGARDTAAYLALLPLLRDSARVVASPVSPDASERFLTGEPYTPECVRHVNEDRQGFTLFTPLLLAHGGGNVYARDFGARDTILLHAFPARPIYLLRPAVVRTGEPPRFYALSADSLAAAWGVSASSIAPAAANAGSDSVISRAPRRKVK